VRLQFIGCGDAFGSGGRTNTCIHVTGAKANFLFDCGASVLPAMKTFGVDRNAIDVIFITHFHADHFGGVPFFALDGQFVSKRQRPLVLAGPPGTTDWYRRAMTTAFPGERILPYEFTIRELKPGQPQDVAGMRVTPRVVKHDDRAGPCLTYRVETEGKVVGYSGDTEWVEALRDSARDADLFVSECYMFEREAPTHMNYTLLREKLPEMGAKRVILTHMSDEMLANLCNVKEEAAKDGMVVEF
jgi:ribonuclease BN (tRNA processing enzyme)